MKQKERRIKISKLKRGMVSSHPEMVIGLKLMKDLGIYEELKREDKGEVFLKEKIFEIFYIFFKESR